MKCFKTFCIGLFFVILSCEKKVDNFAPTIKFEELLKNAKLNKAYSEFRIDNVGLFSGIEERESFMKFARETNNDVLISLTECDKPIIRCYAFKALVEKDYPYIRQVLFKHKKDNEFIEYGAGQCIRMKRTVSSYMLLQLDPYSKSKNKFTKTEYDKIQKVFWKE